MNRILEGIYEGKRRTRHKSLPIFIVSVILGFVFNWLFFVKIPGISVAIFTALILGFTYYFADEFKQPLNKSTHWLLPAIAFFSLMVFVRANPFLTFINICLVLYLLLMVIRLAIKPKLSLQQYAISQYFDPLTKVPVRVLQEFKQFSTKVLSYRGSAVSKSSALPIVRGLIFSLPVLIVFLLLLSSADLVFKKYIGSIFTLDISPELFFRVGLIGFVASVCMGALALMFMPSPQPKAAEPALKKFDIGATESSIILGSVGVLFFAFVLIQLTYLFGGPDQVASTGHTYAEYARKGFFELIAVAAISLGLILTLKKGTTFQTSSQGLVFKWLSSVLVAEVMVIVASAHMRLNLYEDAYGFTTLRLWSHLFILWLVAAFIMLLVHLIRESNEKGFALQLFISVLAFFALINLLNPDAFIARENIRRFNDIGKLDAIYLNTLSQDATPAIAKLLDNPNKEAQKSATIILYNQKRSGENDQKHWQSANLARMHADRVFDEYAKQIERANTPPISNSGLDRD